jgi:hypothetical protein
MSLQEVDLTGGDSVFCINTSQMKRARSMISEDSASSTKINTYLDDLSSKLSRNEQAALAFLLIERLQKTGAESG